MRITPVLGTLLVFIVACSPLSQPAAPAPAPPVTQAPAVVVPSPTAAPQAPTPTPAGPRTVTFTTEDGLTFDGRLFGQSNRWAVLAHMVPADQKSWWDFAPLVSKEGFAALTFDFRGRGGSQGPLETAKWGRDVHAALRFAQQQGASKTVLVGASMGGTAALKVASQADVAGVAAISSSPDFEVLYPEDVRTIRAPKLFIVAQDDERGGYLRAANAFMQASSEPKELKVFPGAAHGTDLFQGPSREEFSQTLLRFIRTGLQ